MNWVGSAERLKPYELADVAKEIGVEPAALRAVQQVEASGSGFDAKDRPKALFERHHFYRNLKNDPDKLERAIDEGLAYVRWGTRPYPKGSDAVYAELTKAADIDVNATLLSTSWGMGQVMGFNFKSAGCASVEEMWEQAKRSERDQLRHMAMFIKNAGLVSTLNAKNWAAFAKAYNGPGYAQNQYDVKLAKAYQASKASEYA